AKPYRRGLSLRGPHIKSNTARQGRAFFSARSRLFRGSRGSARFPRPRGVRSAGNSRLVDIGHSRLDARARLVEYRGFMADQDRFVRALLAVARGLGRIARERARAGDVTPQQAETL